ncbi:MAG: amidohydrolase family protein, partial [Proteobacteria bacterium]|nr:amidohydrolase family protein [Pseudomonadota bacterium]
SPLMFFFKLFDAIITQACLEGFFGGTAGQTYNCYRDMVDTFEIPEQKLFCPFLFPMQYARAMHAGRADIRLSDLAVKTDLSKIQKELGRPIAIILDECDVLSQSRVHLQKLRNIFMNTPGFILVIAGTPQLFPMMDDVFSPIVRQFKRIQVRPFENREETRACIENRLEVLWHHGVSTGRLTMNEFVRVTSTNAAQIFNIYPRKGSVSVGADADIVVWDPQASKTISVKTHHQKIDYNIFEGMTVKGCASHTISQGRVVYADGKLDVERGAGRYVDRPPYAPYYEALQIKAARAEPTPVQR